MRITRTKNLSPLLSAALAALSISCGSSASTSAEFEVRWSVDGETTVTVCQDISVDTWVIEARSGNSVVDTVELSCDEGWTTEDAFAGIAPGRYTVTVIGLDNSGNEVGRSFSSEVTFDGSETVVDVPLFTAIDVYWNINGTVDGTATGDSWDTCAEVGAEIALVTVDDRTPVEADCDVDRNMNIALKDLAVGNHTVKVRLQDGQGNDLTTEATATFAVAEVGAEFVVDFFYDSFFEPKQSDTLGTYWFETLFEGTGCDGTSPPVARQVALLELDGTPVEDAVVCDADQALCTDADGAQTLTCSDLEQVIPDLTWGVYKIVLQGTVGEDDTICWETEDNGDRELEILVGAGDENPVEPIDLARFSDQGECSPG